MNSFVCEELGGLVLPLPAPESSAVDAGVFGFEIDGPVLPDASDIRMLTVEHTRDLLHAWEALVHLTNCAQRSLSPTTGRLITTQKDMDSVYKSMNKNAEQLWNYYSAMLEEYASAFGLDAARMLHQSVKQPFKMQVVIPLPKSRVTVQKELF